MMMINTDSIEIIELYHKIFKTIQEELDAKQPSIGKIIRKEGKRQSHEKRS